MIEFQAANGMRYTIILLFSLLLLSLNVAGTASADIQVSISPSTQHVDEGLNFTISVYVEPDVPISGGQFNLVFDSSLVSVTGVTEGDLLNQDGASTIFNPGTINNSQGTVTDVYGVILGTSNVSTPGIFANISLIALNKSGTSTFEMSNVVFSNSTGDSLPVIVNNGDASIGDVTTPPSNGGGGGGGGGGGTSGEAFENIECTETDREYVNRASDISYNFKLECNFVEYINFTAVTSSGDVAAKVEILKDTSTFVDQASPGIVFKNLNIWVGNFGWATEKNIKDPEIGFKVDRSWVSQNNIDESTIAMYRYDEGRWNPLTTTKMGDDAGYLYFEARTPGFSPFAITGSRSSAATATDQIVGTGKEPGSSGQTPAMETLPTSVAWEQMIPGLLIAVFAVFYIIIVYLSHKIRRTILFCKDELKDPATVGAMNKLIKGPDLFDGRFKEVSLTKEAKKLLEHNPRGEDLIRFNRLLLESAYPQEIIKRLNERSGLKHWILLAIILLIPLVGLIDMIGIPLNWVIGILLELICIVYLVLTLKHYTATSNVN
ncbi:MAG: PGF-pre-PGF domain-containing protein [ANME-2 cluster archaeon]|nr:PGF-pre-PGF domain-containing protein [ANME-2 cluster archaeon]